MDIKEILSSLSEEQKRAVTTTEGNIRLVAGAGSGKTNTLTKRVAYLCMAKGIEPNRVLSLTFTNKAADEMKQRVASYMDVPTESLEMMTFHRLALDIVKKDLGRLGFATKPDESTGEPIADISIGSTPVPVLAKELFAKNAALLQDLSEEEKKFFMSKVISYTKGIVNNCHYVDLLLDENEELASPKAVIEFEQQKELLQKENAKITASISKLRKQIKDNYGHNNECYEVMDNIRELAKQKKTTKMLKVEGDETPTLSWSRALLKMKRLSKTLSFDDIIMFADYLLSNYDEVRVYWQAKYDYIQVDEFQDTDYSQLHILQMLAEKSHGIFVVGDPDQSIYMFRGVKPDIFNGLEAYMPDLQTIYMQDNYRSSEAVLGAANEVIELNPNRLKKELRAKNSNMNEVNAPLICVGTEQYSAAQLEFIQIKKMLEHGVDANNIAVLYRDKNCTVTGELVKLLQNEDIPLDCQYKATGYADTFADIVLNLLKFRFSRSDNFLGNFLDGLYGEDYAEVFDAEILQTVSTDSGEAVFNLIETLYPKRYSKAGQPIGKYKKFCEASTEIQTVIQTTIDEWDALSDKEKQIACSEDSILDTENEMADGIHIMTIHKSKGLEFDYVFCNMDNGMLPKLNNFTNLDSLEEDVRLAYVAITRAKKQVYIGFQTLEDISPMAAQAFIKNPPIHAKSIKWPETQQLQGKVAEFLSLMDCYYLLNKEGIYALMNEGITVGYRYATMYNGSRVYFHGLWDDVNAAGAIPGTDTLTGKVEVPIINGKVTAYEELSETVPVIYVTDPELLKDLFQRQNPLRAVEQWVAEKKPLQAAS